MSDFGLVIKRYGAVFKEGWKMSLKPNLRSENSLLIGRNY